MTRPVHVLLGAGPGLGLAVARRFAAEGYDVALAGRDDDQGRELAGILAREGVEATGRGVDLADPQDVTRVVTALGEWRGRIDVLHFNPSLWREEGPLELTVEHLLTDVAVGAGALLPAVQAALPFLGEGARVLVTGSAAADTPSAVAPTLGVQKAAVRNLALTLDAALEPRGVRIATVQINGVLAKEGPFSPPPIAEAMWRAMARGADEWAPLVAYDG
ncbi:SDR family NAD(P)-dependent oxidoreductase [Nocardioides caeni]|uniref:SDR family oxidoreductase n=1 Tax=Nocardioides caeni TaxID=574700 RepID=A0A4S8MZJ5_9ACTN|nr:SDR family oxidoreductase [Nocardioides caeni]THV08863.1 SDR family oxidoreductase [Nocardioides caeni]